MPINREDRLTARQIDTNDARQGRPAAVVHKDGTCQVALWKGRNKGRPCGRNLIKLNDWTWECDRHGEVH
jgi:hypothetical protein